MMKLDGLTVQKETMHLRINEMRYILDQYKDELRDLGGDPDLLMDIPEKPQAGPGKPKGGHLVSKLTKKETAALTEDPI
jgi:hypothetical protein